MVLPYFLHHDLSVDGSETSGERSSQNGFADLFSRKVEGRDFVGASELNSEFFDLVGIELSDVLTGKEGLSGVEFLEVEAFALSDNSTRIHFNEFIDFGFEGSLAVFSFQVEGTEGSFGGLVVFGGVLIIDHFVIEVSIPSFGSQKTVNIENFQRNQSMHGSVSGSGSEVGNPVGVNVFIPFFLNGEGVGQEDVFSFLSEVIRNEETSNSSFDLVESCSSSLVEQVLIRMASTHIRGVFEAFAYPCLMICSNK